MSKFIELKVYLNDPTTQEFLISSLYPKALPLEDTEYVPSTMGATVRRKSDVRRLSAFSGAWSSQSEVLRSGTTIDIAKPKSFTVQTDDATRTGAPDASVPAFAKDVGFIAGSCIQ